LAAALELTRAGRDVMVIEARDRVGGRCWTRHMAGLAVPIELGAEFIHGEARATRRLLREAGVTAVDSGRVQRWRDRGRLRPVDAFAEAQRALKDVSLERDVSFETLLATLRLPRKTETFARAMVQGFDAADPRRVSARSILEEWGEGALGDSQPRPHGGYSKLMDWLAQSVVARGARMRLQSPVHALEWRRGRAMLSGTFVGRSFSVRARRVIVTLPLGVLQSGPLRFAQKRKALARLASGPVIRVAMRFDRGFWQSQWPDVAFFHAPQAPFPTLWTPLPMRAPLLMAWAGGPKAARLRNASQGVLLAAALESVKTIFRRVPDVPADVLIKDWARDPLSKGAYSYLRVSGEGARRDLSKPIDGTVFFAGEATHEEEAGTVSGALASGFQAAKAALAEL
jgi:monoamine oxidase